MRVRLRSVPGSLAHNQVHLTSKLAPGIKAAFLLSSCALRASSHPVSCICAASEGGTAPA